MAAGPKVILEEFLADAKKAGFALGHAAGCDLIGSLDDWSYLHTRYSELATKIEELLKTTPEGSYEEIMKAKYGNKDHEKNPTVSK